MKKISQSSYDYSEQKKEDKDEWRGFALHSNRLIISTKLSYELSSERANRIVAEERKFMEKCSQQNKDDEQKNSDANNEEIKVRTFESTDLLHKLYNFDELEEAVAKVKSSFRERDDVNARKELYSTLVENSEHRILARIDATSYKDKLYLLKKNFPNFAEVTEFLRGEIAFALKSDSTIRVDPLLLDGPPGCGKTEYSKQLADLFGIGVENFYVENMATSQSSGALCGTSIHYANTKSGRIFDVLTSNKIANPLFLLDEIDKVAGDKRWSPASALYSLLSDGSKKFNDESVAEITIDASRIVWVLTSNYAENIEPALLSRMRKFEIPMPTVDESRIIVRNIFRSLQKEMSGAINSLSLSEDAVDCLVSLSPRKIKQEIKAAAGRALVKNVSSITGDHVTREKAKASIGFV